MKKRVIVAVVLLNPSIESDDDAIRAAMAMAIQLKVTMATAMLIIE
jgi:hypothetical protein